MSTTTDIYGTRTLYYTIGGLQPNEYETSTLDFVLDIYETTKFLPIVGIEHEERAVSWDLNLLPSDLVENYRQSTFLDLIESNVTEGSSLTDYVSGKISGLNIKKINNYFPEVTTGSYTVYHHGKNLYSDYSVSDTIDTDNTNDEGYVFYDLVSGYRSDSISINKYKLLDDKFYQSVISYRKVEEFEDTNDYQFIVDNDQVILNRNPILKHGKNIYPVDFSNIRNYCLKLGNGNGAAKDFFLPYAPSRETMQVAYVLYANGTVERWAFVDNLNTSLRTDTHLILNKDLGIISCGGTTYDSLVLNSSVSELDTEISFITIDDIENYPLKGILNIGSEQIYFQNRTQNIFLDCTRGYNSTTASSHEAYSLIEIEQNGFPISEYAELYITYQSSARIEYEITDHTIRTSNISVKPSEYLDASQILQIIPKITDLDRLYLSSDETVISNNKYGPLNFGIDTARCEVEAFNSMGNTVSNIEVTLEILYDGPGLINGDSSEAIQMTNSNGKCYFYFNSPVDINDYAQKYNSINTDGGVTSFVFDNLDSLTEEKEISIFQILKHDPTIGSNGIKTIISAYAEDSTFEDSLSYITVENKIEDIYLGGLAFVVDKTNYIYTRTITHIVGNRIYLDQTVNSGLLSYCYLIAEGDISWNSELLNGVNVILYNWNDSAEHPITGNLGAYSPVIPDSISGETISYNVLLPTPEPENIDNNLGGYMIIAPINVYLRARAEDPYSGNVIYSNIISFKITLPDYLVGVDNTNLPIPKGFNIITDENNIGNGLGGANFISINKKGGLYGLQLRFNS